MFAAKTSTSFPSVSVVVPETTSARPLTTIVSFAFWLTFPVTFNSRCPSTRLMSSSTTRLPPVVSVTLPLLVVIPVAVMPCTVSEPMVRLSRSVN